MEPARHVFAPGAQETRPVLGPDDGVILAGIKRIIELTNQVSELQQRVAELSAALERERSRPDYRPELIPPQRNTALVVWQPRNRRR